MQYITSELVILFYFTATSVFFSSVIIMVAFKCFFTSCILDRKERRETRRMRGLQGVRVKCGKEYVREKEDEYVLSSVLPTSHAVHLINTLCRSAPTGTCVFHQTIINDCIGKVDGRSLPSQATNNVLRRRQREDWNSVQSVQRGIHTVTAGRSYSHSGTLSVASWSSIFSRTCRPSSSLIPSFLYYSPFIDINVDQHRIHFMAAGKTQTIILVHFNSCFSKLNFNKTLNPYSSYVSKW